MGKHYLHSVIVEQQTPAGDGVQTHDLPVRPLSAIIINVTPLNETSTITDYQPAAGILDAFNSIRVLHNGQTIVDLRGRDLAAMNLYRWHRTLAQSNQVNTDNDRRSLAFPIFFGRFLGDPEWGIPATRAGQLIITLDVDIADTGYDALQYTIEAIELPDANMRSFIRLTTIAQTFLATGRNDVVLPIGHELLGLLLFNTTEYAGAAPNPGLGRLSLIADGLDTHYGSSDFETLRAVSALAGRPYFEWVESLVSVNVAASTETDSRLLEQQHEPFDEYAFMDLDVTRDGMYSLDTRPVNRLVLRSDAHVAEAMRVLPCERVDTATFFKT